MKPLLFPFIVLSAIGLFFSLIVHIYSLFGLVAPGGELVGLLHTCLFIVLIPAVLVATRLARYAPIDRYWDAVLLGCPLWMKRMFYIFFCYAFFNGVVAALISINRPTPVENFLPDVLRLASSIWMAFYFTAFATLYSATHRTDLMKDIKCSNGHTVSPTDRFCPKCGAFIPTRTNTSR